MKKIELKASEINAKTLTNLFLYGEKTTPKFEELKDDSFIADRDDITIYISDMDSYMSS